VTKVSKTALSAIRSYDYLLSLSPNIIYFLVHYSIPSRIGFVLMSRIFAEISEDLRDKIQNFMAGWFWD
jgi:hypothetical protein